jgi:hypothetical protein
MSNSQTRENIDANADDAGDRLAAERDHGWMRAHDRHL